MKKSICFLAFTLLLLHACSSSENNPPIVDEESSKLYANIGDERLVEINLENGNESLITNFQSDNILSQMIFLNNEFIGVKESNGTSIIKKINLLTGNVTTLTTINNYVNIIPSDNGKLYANIGDEKIVEINLVNGSESLIVNLQSNNLLSQMILIDDEFIGVQEINENTSIKKIQLSNGAVSTLAVVNNFVDLIPSDNGKLYASIGNERLVEINLTSGSETLIMNIPSNDVLSQIILLNDEFIGARENNGNTTIKKVSLMNGAMSTLTTINDYVNIIQ